MIKYTFHIPMKYWEALFNKVGKVVFEAENLETLLSTLKFHRHPDFIDYTITENGYLIVEMSSGQIFTVLHIIEGLEEVYVMNDMCHRR